MNNKQLIDIIGNIKIDPYKYTKNLQISEIEQIIKYLSDEYYNKGKSLVSDNIYDSLITILENKDPSNSLLNKIGAKVKRSIKFFILYGKFKKNKTRYRFNR